MKLNNAGKVNQYMCVTREESFVMHPFTFLLQQNIFLFVSTLGKHSFTFFPQQNTIRQIDFPKKPEVSASDICPAAVLIKAHYKYKG